MEYITDSYEYNGKVVNLTWIPGEKPDGLSPITQVYGLCFDDQNRLLVIRPQGAKGNYIIPGGHPEGKEIPIETLDREMKEEANITATNFCYLGAQKVEIEGEITVYQLRFAARIAELHPRKIDPADKIIYRRHFINPEKFSEVTGWGEIGEELVKGAKSKLNI